MARGVQSIMFLITSFVFFLFSCSGADQGSSQRSPLIVEYVNTRFYFAIRVPSEWKLEESDNGDGVELTLPDTPDVKISVAGSHNIWNIQDVKGLYEFSKKLAGKNFPCTYIHLGGLSGIEYSFEKGDIIIKRRKLLGEEIIYELYLEAPTKVLPRALQAFEEVCRTFEVSK